MELDMSEDKKFYELFEDKTLSNVFKDIYNNATKTRNQVMGLITQLKPFVKSLDSAATIVPLIREYMEILVRNDEHLIKLTDTAVRLLKDSRVKDETTGYLSEVEKEQILKNVSDYHEYKKIENENKKTIDERVDAIKDGFLGEVEKEEIEKVEEKVEEVE
jgi:hypothetical protein